MSLPKFAPLTGDVLPPETSFDEQGYAVGARPLCPFCSKPWGDGAMKLYDLDAGDHCQSGRFYAECCSVSISCDGCGREMYRKDGVAFGY